MKQLKFSHIEAENITKGAQTATIRLHDEKNISVNDTISVVDKVKESDPSTWLHIGTARVTKIIEQEIGDLNLEQGQFEKYGSTAELYRQLAHFYGDEINDSTVVKVIYFTFNKESEESISDKNDAITTTEVREIKLYCDGGSRGNPGPSASGYVLLDMADNVFDSNGEFLHITTNNQAEYHSLIIGLERALQVGARVVHVFMDSLLVIKQLKGEYRVKNKDLLGPYQKVKTLVSKFDKVHFTHVPRELNKLADAEVNRILDSNKKMV